MRTEMAAKNLGDMLAPESTRFSLGVETVLITTAACALGWWASPADPLLLQSGFSWLWLAPVLIALRYGVMPGIFSAFGLLGDWALYVNLSGQSPDPPRAFFIGGVLLTLICGEFHAVWRNRIERRDEVNLYLNERLTRLSRRYLLLHLSHDHIEQELLVRPGSLREALVHLRELNPGASTADPLPNVEVLLQLMAQYCQLESAAVYLPPKGNGHHYTMAPPLAAIGKPPQLQGDDPMLLKAMEQRKLVHVVEQMAEQSETSHLVVAPILTSDDRVLGILAVSHIPFLALNRENLLMLDLLLSYYADVVQVGSKSQALRQELPGCPWSFVEELVRMQRIQRRTGIASHVVVFRFSGDKAFEIASEVKRMRRGLDIVWSVDHGDHHTVAVLLPLSSGAGSEGYILRIQNWLKERYGIGSDEPGFGVINLDMSRSDAIARLRAVMQCEEMPS
ncbi:MAG: PelD GGDEF domain-containing protein [Aggregatilineaceae bacterium]